MAKHATPSTAEAACQSPEAFTAWTEELLLLEHEAEDEETTEMLMSCTHAELQERGIAILKLHVAEQTTALYGRTCLTLERQGGAPLPTHRITHGDIVGLFDQTLRPLSKAVPLASAVVQRVRGNSIALAFDGDIPIEVLDGRPLNLGAVSSEVTLKRYKDALNALKSGAHDGPAAGLVALCFGEDVKPAFRPVKTDLCTRPDAMDCTFFAPQSSKLNEPQQAAIVKALCAVNMAIIHGPPGTGKTTTMVAYILEAAYRKQKLLVTAPSNVAVDNVLERVVECGFKSVVRLGHPARVQTELHQYTMDNVVYNSDQAALCRDIKKEIDDAFKNSTSGRSSAKAKAEARRSTSEINNLRKELRTRERKAVAEVLRHTQVVFATCAGAATLQREIKKGGEDLGKSLEFDVVIIDEAAQSLEVACWIPLLLGKKAVLAGDHHQLSATVKSTEAQRRGLDRTLFGRMIEKHGDDVAALLAIQYRMNATIMGWSSRSFYDQRLVAADSVSNRILELTEVPADNIVAEIIEALHAPLLFVDTGGLAIYREDGDVEASEAKRLKSGVQIHQSRSNPGEARFLVHYAKMLVKAGLRPQDITVISPYNRQVELLRNTFSEDSECERMNLQKPRINTVDSFQGQEADAVLLSLVRSNERGVVGFLSDYRRLNVAVTRARKHVMIVGDASTISCDKMLGSLYDYACEHGKVLFVQQLLDEEGKVPPDPSAVQEPRKTAKAKGKMQKAADKREQDDVREQQLRQKMEEQLKPLLTAPQKFEFPSTLNPYERAIAHEVATALGLKHESKGEGMQRHLVVWSPGFETSGSEVDLACSKNETKKSSNAQAQTRPIENKTDESKRCADAGSDSDAETAVQAFERRAGELISSLGPENPVAEWKNPSEEERRILTKLASGAGLPAPVMVGSGKKQRCRIELEVEDTPKPVPATSSGDSGGCSNLDNNGGTGKGGVTNSTLAELNAERQRRQAKAAEERKQQNESAREELNMAKKAGKQKLKGVGAGNKQGGDDEDDLDAILAEVAAKDGICAFGTCKEKTHMLMDAISVCQFCKLRFCIKHKQAEMHGCGDAAQRAEQKKFRQEWESASNGSALTGKSCKDNRSQVAGKLQEKINKQQSSRTVQKKDKK